MTTIIRASAFQDFLDCPARAEAKHLLKLRTPASGAIVIGKAVHASTAVFDRSTIEHAGITADEAAAAAVDAVHKPDEDVVWGEDESPTDAEHIAVALHGRYCKEIAPKQTYAAIEVQCEHLEISDLQLVLTGTTDRVRQATDPIDSQPRYGISDLKTGKSAVRADGHVETKGNAYQLGIYELLAEHASGIAITEPAQIVGLQVAKTERGQRVGIGEVHGVRDVLLGDQDSPGVLQIVARMIQSGIFHGNPRSMLCHEKYCPIYQTCKFRR